MTTTDHSLLFSQLLHLSSIIVPPSVVIGLFDCLLDLDQARGKTGRTSRPTITENSVGGKSQSTLNHDTGHRPVVLSALRSCASYFKHLTDGRVKMVRPSFGFPCKHHIDSAYVSDFVLRTEWISGAFTLFIGLRFSVRLKPFKLRSFPLMPHTAATGPPVTLSRRHMAKRSFGIDGM
ncbi:hypothetical protein B0H19DRAFT_1085472 [Mycena capillaripes]|nr:hypothetical protein B0H19DRAFT_1085472 [Mycena capillaripes]